MNDFAELLKRLRIDAGLSQSSLAQKAGVDPSYINRIEKGQRQPPSQSIIRELATALELDSFNTGQLLLSAGYAASTPKEPQFDFHPGLHLVNDFLGDEDVLPEHKDLIERDLDLIEQHIRLIRKQRLREKNEGTMSG